MIRLNRKAFGMAVALAICGCRELPGQKHSTPGIAGDIDEGKALNWLYGNYNPETKTSADDSDDMNRWVQSYAQQEVLIDGKRQWFLYTISNVENNTCHGCSVMLGAAMFEKQGEWWIEKASTRKLGGIGSNGEPPPYRLVRWGARNYGLVAEDSWSDHGRITSYDLLFGYWNGQFKSVFGLNKSFDNYLMAEPDPEATWAIEWHFSKPGPSGAFDIVVSVKVKGKRAKDVPAPGVYRYDGERYRHAITHNELGKT